MEWKDFNIEQVNTPNETIEKTINGFEKATKGLLKLNLIEKSDIERMRKKNLPSFQYDLVLHSPFMPNYKFDVLELFYDVTLYPCILIMEDGIDDELNINPFDKNIKLQNEEELKQTLEKLFNTKRFESIIAGLMKITTVSKNTEDDYPF